MPVRLTPAVKVILVACIAAFIVQHTSDQFFGGNLLGIFGLVPADVVVRFRVWQLVTYAFLHSDVLHLVLNMMMLVFIGGELESLWGSRRFVRFYLLCTTGAALTYLFLQLFVWKGNAPLVGSSGGIYGLLMAYGLLFGERVLLFMMLFPMKAKQFVWILVGIEFLSSVFSARGGLGSVAHLGGMAVGFLLIYGRAFWSVSQKRKQQKGPGSKKSRLRRGESHLKLVINKKPKEDENDSENGPKTWH